MRQFRILAAVALAGVAGCAAGGEGGSLRAVSLGRDPVFLDGRYVTAFYADHDATETSFFLSDVPLPDLLAGEVTEGQVVHLDLLWIPKAGATPMDPTATNASVRYVVITGGEVGVYGGSGFAFPRGPAGRTTLSVWLREASLTLLDSTPGFVDLLSPALLSGNFTAVLDERRTHQLRYAVSQLVTDALGRGRFVRRPPLFAGGLLF